MLLLQPSRTTLFIYLLLVKRTTNEMAELRRKEAAMLRWTMKRTPPGMWALESTYTAASYAWDTRVRLNVTGVVEGAGCWPPPEAHPSSYPGMRGRRLTSIPCRSVCECVCTSYVLWFRYILQFLYWSMDQYLVIWYYTQEVQRVTLHFSLINDSLMH